MKKSYKILSLILAVVVSLGMLFAVFFISNNAHHDCVGDECPICQQLMVVESFVRLCGTTVISFASCLFMCVLARLCKKFHFILFAKNTPVKLKVRLLN